LLAAQFGENLVSEPVGSTTTISASAPSSAMVKCSGRMPYTAGRPSELAAPMRAKFYAVRALEPDACRLPSPCL